MLLLLWVVSYDDVVAESWWKCVIGLGVLCGLDVVLLRVLECGARGCRGLVWRMGSGCAGEAFGSDCVKVARLRSPLVSLILVAPVKIMLGRLWQR